MKKITDINWKMVLWNRILRYSCLFLSDEKYLKYQYRYRTGKKLDIKHPKTFTEKIQWLKLYDRDHHPEYSIYVDKYAAKDYVASIIGIKHIIPTIGLWDSVECIDWTSLPNQFVIKATNDSGGIIICKDKARLCIQDSKKKLKAKGGRDYSKFNKEYPYKNVKHKFIAEQYIEDKNGCLNDYKFFCFGGVARYCQLISDRYTDESIDFYDRDWIHQPFIGLNPYVHNAQHLNQRPENYSKMLEIADLLSTSVGSPFVRIDLYNVDGEIYFGEITFYPLSGMGSFRPHEWDEILGNLISLPQ